MTYLEQKLVCSQMIPYGVLSTWSDANGLEEYLPLLCLPVGIIDMTWIG